MKKSFFYVMILAGALSFSLNSSAQQARQTPPSPKPAEVTGKKLQSDKTANATEPVVSPAVADQSMTTTPALKSSEVSPKITKLNEPEQAKVSQPNPPPVSAVPSTDKLGMPKNLQKEISDSKTAPGAAKVKE